MGLVVVMLVAVACGLGQSHSYADSHSGAQIVSDASAAMSKAGSYHMKLQGNFTNGIASADIDVEGISYKGTIGAAGQSVRIIDASGDTFVYGADSRQSWMPRTPSPLRSSVQKRMTGGCISPPRLAGRR